MSIQHVIGYSRVSSKGQDHIRQEENLKKFAGANGFRLSEFFCDTITGKSMTSERSGYKKMLAYANKNDTKTIFFSEISRIGRRVSDVITTIEKLVEENGFTLYIQHPSQMVFKRDENGKIDILQKSMLMMLSLGAETELHYQSARRLEGIEIAKRKGKYKGRVSGSTYSNEQLLTKHSDIVNLINHSTLPDTQIAATVKKGLSTVKRIKKVLKAAHEIE